MYCGHGQDGCAYIRRHPPLQLAAFERRWAIVANRVQRIVLGWPGNDLLSRALRHSTIGAAKFNGRVRDGIGF